ncbi:MAG: alpha/beta hydrolase [Pseudomonadota bacterium]
MTEQAPASKAASTAPPPLLLIHGMWASPRLWRHMTPAFSAAGHEVLAPALPGHEATPGDPAPDGLGTLSLSDYVEALLAQAAKFTRPPVVIGHSMGGLLAQLVAAKLRPPALVLLSPAPAAGMFALYPSALRTLSGVMLKWEYWKKPTLLGAKAARYGIFNGVPEAEAKAEIAALIHDSGRALFEIANWFVDRRRAAQVDYGEIDCPALIMVGDQDRITPTGVARQTARRLQGRVRYREIADHGHWIVGEAMGPQVARDILAFLGALASRK